MPPRGRINADALFRMARDAGIETEVLRRELLRVVGVSALATQAEARLKAPVFSGELAGGIMTQGPRLISKGERFLITDRVFATSPQGLPMEEGRAPGESFPPLAIIRRWVALKVRRNQLDVSWTGEEGEAAIDSAAYVIAVSIHRKGIKARRFMTQAAAVGGRRLASEVDDTVAKWRRRLET